MKVNGSTHTRVISHWRDIHISNYYIKQYKLNITKEIEANVTGTE